MSVESVSAEHRFRTRKNEDGEVVVRLVGKARGYPSDFPHAGMWSKTRWYIYLPCSQPARRAKIALNWSILKNSLQDHSGDSELLLLGTEGEILALLTSGPAWIRARHKATRTTDQKLAASERLAPHRFKSRAKPARTGSGALAPKKRKPAPKTAG
jgi:hypothetical protein